MHLDLNAHEGPEDFALPVEVRVKQGVALLDEKHGPGWVWRIDVDTLDLANACRCVVGQLYRTDKHDSDAFDNGLDTLLPRGDEEVMAAHYGFVKGAHDHTWAALTTAWRHAILARRLELGQ